MKNKNFFLIILLIIFISCSNNKNITKQDNKQEIYTINSLIIDAVTALNNQDFNKAEMLYKQVLDKDKDNAVAKYYLSNIYYYKQDMTTSIDYAKQAIKIDENNIWYKLQLVDIYLSLQDYDNAADMMEKVIKQKPETIEYWQQLVRIYNIKGSVKEELDCLNRMEARFGINEMTSMLKYNIYKEQGESGWKKAEQEILNLTKTFPNQSKYWSILAEMNMQQKNYDKAFEYYKKVESIDPDNELINVTFANYYLTKHNEDSLYYYLKKTVAQNDIDFQTKLNIILTVYQDNIDEDSISFTRFFTLLKTMQTTQDSMQCRLWSLLNIGYMRTQDFKQGVYSAEKAIDLGCINFDMYQNLLFAANTYALPDEVISYADKTIEMYPEQPIAYLFKGVNLQQIKDYENAIETLKIGLNRSGNDKIIKEDFYMNLGNCYHAIGNSMECFNNYDKVLELNSDNYIVLNNYAYYLALENKDLDKALSYSKKTIDKYPDNLNFIDTYAWILYLKQDYLNAKKIMETVISNRKNWGETMENHYLEILKHIK